ncbi:MAG TPA: hypothetical protein VJ718_08565 [Candidatus Binataceae bacterium]|nr:hypothetical protein [Candidatus Binataceae bacterium]
MAREIAVWIARAGVLAATIIATPIGKAYEDRDNRAFSLWVAAAIFLSPIEWAHYMVLLLIPFLNMARAACAGRVGERPLRMAAANIAYSAFWIPMMNTTIPEYWAGFGPLPPLPLMLIAESGVAVMLMGYVAAYWFAIDRGGAGQAVVEPPLVRSTLPA